MIIQIIGFIGFIALGISNLKQKRKDILFYQIISSFFFSAHYYLLGALTASIVNAFGITRGIVFYNKEGNSKKYYYLLFIYILVFSLIGVFTYENYYSLLPIFAYILYTIVAFVEKEKIIKIICFIVSLLWLVYDIIYKSYAGIISDTCMLITILIGLYLLRQNSSKE